MKNDEIVLPERQPTLESLIHNNLSKETLAAVPVNDPTPDSLLDASGITEAGEALEFALVRYSKRSGNRFVRIEHAEDPAFSAAMKVLTDLVQKSQVAYDRQVDHTNKMYALKEKMRKDADSLLHTKEIKKAVDALKKATLPVVARMDEIENGVRINDVVADDVYSFFAIEALRKLHWGNDNGK